MRICSARKTPPVLEASVDGEKRIEHRLCGKQVCNSKPSGSNVAVAATRLTVHCEMFNLVLTLNSIKNFTSFSIRNISCVGDLLARGCELDDNVSNVSVVIVIISVNQQVRHRGIGRFLLRDAVRISSSALAATPWLTPTRTLTFAFVALSRGQVSV